MLTERALAGRAEQCNRTLEFGCSLGETLREPALGGTERRAGAHAYNGLFEAEFAEPGGAAVCGFRGAGQTNSIASGQLVDNAGAPQQLEIVKLLMSRDFVAMGRLNGASEKPAAGVSSVSDPFGDTGQGGDERRFKGVRQQDGHVEFLLAKEAGHSPLAGEILPSGMWFVRDYLVGERLVRIEVRHPGAGQHRDVGFRMYAPKHLQCR